MSTVSEYIGGSEASSRAFILVAMFLNSAAFGILMVQVYLYYVAFPKDPLHCKILVYVIFTLEMGQTSMGSRTLFQGMVYDFMDPLSIDRVRDLWVSFPILGGLVTFVVQIFYARRIIILGRQENHVKSVGIIIIMLSVLQLITNIVAGIELDEIGSFIRAWRAQVRVPFVMFNSFGIMCDVMIAVNMTIILTRTNPTTHRTRKLIRKILRLTVQTGSLTVLFLMVNIVLSFLRRNYSYYQVTNILISKVYANSVLVTLNSRMDMKERSLRKQDVLSGLRFASLDIA